MAYTDLLFFAFFAVCALIYFVIPKKARRLWLVLCCYVFIFKWSVKSAVFTLAVTFVTFLSAVIMDKIDSSGRDDADKSKHKKKAVLTVSAVLLFGTLLVLKYSEMFVDTVVKVINKFGGNCISVLPDIILPVGLSFYTFATVGYMIDVYKGKVKAEKNIIKYSLFVSFFPNFTAGPIERSDNLLKQIRDIENVRLWDYERVANGTVIMIWGYFLKLVIADRAAVLVNNVFDNFWQYGSVELLLGAVVFSVQIYADFAGGSYMALGCAKILGFDLIDNFKSPYFSRSIKEFWRRWHISLSSWFKDYLYIPLGGNRRGEMRKYLNMMIVFLVCGMWHGASWTFLVWGFVHGMYQFIGGITEKKRSSLYHKMGINTESAVFRALQTLCTFMLTAFAWILFKADTLTDGFTYIQRIFTRPEIWNVMNGRIYELGLDNTEMNILFIAVAVMFIADYLKYRNNKTLPELIKSQQIVVRFAIVIALLIAIIFFGCYGNKFGASSFIYAEF